MHLRRTIAPFTLALTTLVLACGTPAPAPTPPVATASPASATAIPTVSPATSTPRSVVTSVPTASPRTATPTSRPAATSTATVEPIGTVEPVAVVIDNLADALPQSGLAQADVVYDAPVEGGISRLMAVFFSKSPDRVGPVRSTRHYFVYLAAEYGATLVHIGASPQGFAALDETGLFDVDESAGATGFSRDPSRFAPHNAYVDLRALRESLEAGGVELAGDVGGLAFGNNPPPPNGKPSSTLLIAYPGGTHYAVEYRYQPSTKRYLRSMDGAPHLDAQSGEQYAARAIVVQVVPVLPIAGDDKERQDVQLLGSGEGFLALEGNVYRLTWSKDGAGLGTIFAYENGDQVTFPRGPIWIQVVPPDADVTAS